MPVIVCPKCKGRLRLPDDAGARRVKCPNCAFVFMSNQAAAEGGTGSKSPPGRPKSSSGASQAGMKKREEPEEDFEVVDDDERPRAKRRVPEDEDDDDRPRAKRRRDDDDDEDDDRPRRRRRDDEDDEDDDDRPRARRRRDDEDEDVDRPRRRGRYDDDEDDYEDSRPSRKSLARQFGNVELGALLVSIAIWIFVGSSGLVALSILLAWMGVGMPPAIFTIAGIVGFGHLLTAAVGFGFFVTGPSKNGGLGLSIALAAVAGVHLVLTIVVLTDSGPNVALLSTPKDLGSYEKRSLDWSVGISSIQNVPVIFYTLVVSGGGKGFPFLPLLTGAVEIARWILLFLYLRNMARLAKNARAGQPSMSWVIAFSAAAGALSLLGLVLGLAVGNPAEGRGDPFAGLKTFFNMMRILVSLSYLTLAGLAAWGAIIAQNVRDTIRYR